MSQNPCNSNPVSTLLRAYERTYLKVHTLDEVLDYARPFQDSSEGGFVVSGLYDLRSTLAVVDEHYRNHVILEWRPLMVEEGTYNPMWGETNGQKRFSTSVRLPTYIRQQGRDYKRSGTGETVTQPATMVLPITELWRRAYLPKVGDQVQYRSTRYEVVSAYVNPEHYWQNTGFPLYWTCEMAIAPQDSRFLGCSLDFELEAGAPSEREPGSVPLGNGEPL